MESYLEKVEKEVIERAIEIMLKLTGEIRRRAREYVKKELGGNFRKLGEILMSPKGYEIAKELLSNLAKEEIRDLIDRLD